MNTTDGDRPYVRSEGKECDGGRGEDVQVELEVGDVRHCRVLRAADQDRQRNVQLHQTR